MHDCVPPPIEYLGWFHEEIMVGSAVTYSDAQASLCHVSLEKPQVNTQQCHSWLVWKIYL